VGGGGGGGFEEGVGKMWIPSVVTLGLCRDQNHTRTLPSINET
jgi:hypothetical protein